MMERDVTGSCTFETALGRCAVSWNERGIVGVGLPAASAASDVRSADDVEVPDVVRRAIAGMTAILAGGHADLADIPLDDRGLDPFRAAVYAETRRIPPGATRSYGEIARAIGQPEAARDVGVALARNRWPIIVPCHRVVAADGALTGFSAPGGLATKRRMLQLEGASGYGQLSLFD
jgi:methylated-DNA-[protein]-cysteine S-methyltransferase